MVLSLTFLEMLMTTLSFGGPILPPPVSAQAAVFVVNTTDDVADEAPGDGICQTAAGNGVCSLRAAIMEANALPGPDTIIVPPGTYVLTRDAAADNKTASSGPLIITEALTITGAGPGSTIIDGRQRQQVFDIAATATVNISGVTVQNGNGSDGGGINNDGSLRLSGVALTNNTATLTGGGVKNRGTLTIINSTIRNNSAGRGGGIGNTGTLTITNSPVTDNTANRYGGGITNDPGSTATITRTLISGNTSGFCCGGIANGGTLTLTASTVSNNRAETSAGLVNNEHGTMQITNSTVSANVATACCGGIGNAGRLDVTGTTISNNRADSGGGLSNNHQGTVAVSNSTISGNSVSGNGSGILNGGILTLTNVTISGNTAGQAGGGLFNAVFEEPRASATLTNVTIHSNSAAEGGGISSRADTMLTLKNSIVANSLSASNCSGAVTSISHNLDSGNSCGFVTPGDIRNTDPKLGPLADNGGPTYTHALRPGSPAIDAGDANGCPPTDQRGATRPQGAGCDIGAYEFGATVLSVSSPAEIKPPALPSVEVGRWLDRPPASPGAASLCPTDNRWFLLYWGGSDGMSIAAIAGICMNADAYWVNRGGRWLGFAPAQPSASDSWAVRSGEAHFMHGR